MGPNRCRDGGVHLRQVVQVVPDLPTFAVDDGFAYELPAGVDGTVGSIVRIPLGGRRLRGWIVSRRDVADPSRPLKSVIAQSGDLPVFGPKLLETLRWAATHYVAPLAVLLARAGPPNLPKAVAGHDLGDVPVVESPLPAVTEAAATGRHHRSQYLIGGGPWIDTVLRLGAPVLAAGRSVLLVMATRTEAERAAAQFESSLPGRVVMATSSLADRTVTTAWSRAATTPGLLVVGTPEVALWPVTALSLAVVVDEGRRAMKGRQTPTVHVRDLLWRRAIIERFPLVFCGPAPTLEVIAAGAQIHEPASRAWRVVEVVDRNEQADRGTLVTDRVRAALRRVVADEGRAFVLVPRRGYAAAFRCADCGLVRRCDSCGAAIDRRPECRRCGLAAGPCSGCGKGRFVPLGAGIGRVVDDLARSVGDAVGTATESRAVTVGTERDLPGRCGIDLGVVIDAEAWLLAPNYRAEEDALRTFARLAGTVGQGSGRRMMVQTALADHRILEALRRGHPTVVLRRLAAERDEAGFPPSGELIAIDVTSEDVDVSDDLAVAAGDDAGLLGPAPSGESQRWLIQGRDLHRVRVRLRPAVQRWRDGGARVRIDADPIDL